MPTLAKMMTMTMQMKMMKSGHCLCRELVHGRGGRIPNSNLQTEVQFSVRQCIATLVMLVMLVMFMSIMQSKMMMVGMRIIYTIKIIMTLCPQMASSPATLEPRAPQPTTATTTIVFLSSFYLLSNYTTNACHHNHCFWLFPLFSSFTSYLLIIQLQSFHHPFTVLFFRANLFYFLPFFCILSQCFYFCIQITAAPTIPQNFSQIKCISYFVNCLLSSSWPLFWRIPKSWQNLDLTWLDLVVPGPSWYLWSLCSWCGIICYNPLPCEAGASTGLCLNTSCWSQPPVPCLAFLPMLESLRCVKSRKQNISQNLSFSLESAWTGFEPIWTPCCPANSYITS